MTKYLKLLRVRHWIKNLFLFAAPFFGGKLFDAATLSFVFPVFMAFSLCASAAYIINDICDAGKDCLHPKKKGRPIAAGSIKKNDAAIFALLVMSSSLAVSFLIGPLFLGFVVAYLSIQLAYSLYLKNIAIVDIFCIASGFVIRVLAGGAAFHVVVSKWLFLTMFMISLVLAAGKRAGEAMLLNDKAEGHRKSLNSYSQTALNEILVISSSSALLSYAMYTVEQFQMLIYTVPVVTFGLFRYLMVSRQGFGDPTEAMTADKWLASTVAIWLLLVGFIRYNKFW